MRMILPTCRSHTALAKVFGPNGDVLFEAEISFVTWDFGEQPRRFEPDERGTLTLNGTNGKVTMFAAGQWRNFELAEKEKR